VWRWRWWRRQRLARVHMRGDAPSLEGVFMGRVGGKHYRLEAASIIESADRSHDLEGYALIPVEGVAFIQVVDG